MSTLPLFIFIVSVVTLCLCIYFVRSSATNHLGDRDVKTMEVQRYINDETRPTPPDGVPALLFLAEEFRKNRDENALLSIVKLYLFGLIPTVSPDKLVGLNSCVVQV